MRRTLLLGALVVGCAAVGIAAQDAGGAAAARELQPLLKSPDSDAVLFWFRVSEADEKKFELFDSAKRPVAIDLAAVTGTEGQFVVVRQADGTDVVPVDVDGSKRIVLVSVADGTRREFYKFGVQLIDRRKDGLVKLVDVGGWSFPTGSDHSLVAATGATNGGSPGSVDRKKDPIPLSASPDREQVVAFSKLLQGFTTGVGASSLNQRDSGLPGVISQVLEDPATLNSVLSAAMGDSGSPLANLDLEFKTFANGPDTSLGVGFEFDRSWNVFESGDDSLYGLDYSLTLRGDIAFEQDLNPQDLIEGRLSLDFFRSSGGVQLDQANDPDPTGKQFNDLATKLATYDTDAAFLGAKEWSDISALAQDRFSTQFYWEIGVDAGMEANQSFTQRNSFVGAHAALDIKAWRRNSLAAWLNFFDHPFALVRTLTGYDRDFTPRGSTIPTVIIGFDHLEPEGNSPRRMAGDRDGFQRFRAEVAFKTPIARTQDSEFFAVINWRYYRELNPSAAIKSAQLDEFDFFTAAVESENGLFLSYAVGRLPFGVTDNEFVELGWKLNF